jgi:signal transduction histidine kinase
VPLDPDGLHQIIMNLLSNALDAVEPQQGLIRVVCKYDPDNKQTVIEVIDNGVGIPPSMMNHLFELFHSTKGKPRHRDRVGRSRRRSSRNTRARSP